MALARVIDRVARSGTARGANLVAFSGGVKKWREKGESFREDRYRCIEGRCLHQIMSAKSFAKNQGYENEDRAQAGNVQSE